MKIISKYIIASYAEAILDIMEHNPTKENTKNIRETLEEIYEEWDEFCSTASEDESGKYDEIYTILDKLTAMSAEYVDAGDYLDFGNEYMVYGLRQLVRLGKGDNNNQ